MSTGTDLLFDGFEKEFHEIGHIRLRRFNSLLGAEQQWIADRQMTSITYSLPVRQKCREIALTQAEFGLFPAQPEREEGGVTIPATEAREFTIHAKANAVMAYLYPFAGKLEDVETQLAFESMTFPNGVPDRLESMTDVIAAVGITQDKAELIAIALRLRGETRSKQDGSWIPLKDTTAEDVKRLPTSFNLEIDRFLGWEMEGWPKATEAATGGKPQGRAKRAPALMR